MSAQIFNAFNNSWPIVQITMLLFTTLTAALLNNLPCWLLSRTLVQLRARQNTLPPNTLLSVALEDDIVILKLRQDSPRTAQEIVHILPRLSEQSPSYPPEPAPDPETTSKTP
jgi:hypothetical protein